MASPFFENTNEYRTGGHKSLGVLRTLKRAIVAAVAIGAFAYVGDKTDFSQLVDKRLGISHSQSQPYKAIPTKPEMERGFYDVTLREKVNSNNRREYYIEYAKPISSDKAQIPVLEGRIGPQAGSIDYVVENSDFEKLTPIQATNVARKAWTRLDIREKYEIVRDDLSRLLR